MSLNRTKKGGEKIIVLLLIGSIFICFIVLSIKDLYSTNYTYHQIENHKIESYLKKEKLYELKNNKLAEENILSDVIRKQDSLDSQLRIDSFNLKINEFLIEKIEPLKVESEKIKSSYSLEVLLVIVILLVFSFLSFLLQKKNSLFYEYRVPQKLFFVLSYLYFVASKFSYYNNNNLVNTLSIIIITIGTVILFGVWFHEDIFHSLSLKNKSGNTISSNNSDIKDLSDIALYMDALIDELTLEQRVSEYRAIINLIVGVFIAILGIGVLFYITIDKSILELMENNENWKTIDFFLIYLIPKITLAIFIELVAFYFLRMYGKQLTESKYYQNEKTNVESKFIALKIAFSENSNSDFKDTLKYILENLVNTERNRLLKKDETTTLLERYKQESNYQSQILELLKQFSKKE